MQLKSVGNIKLHHLENLEKAQLEAQKAAANVSGFSFPVTIFRQGSRISLSGAFPLSFVRSRLERRSAEKRGNVQDAMQAGNRPLDSGHAKNISSYLAANMSGKYILPPLTLNLQQPADVYTLDVQSTLTPGYLVLPLTSMLAITDGQHRVVGVQEAAKIIPSDILAKLDQDAVAVMITCETDAVQVHQDFADAAKTKPLPPSQLAVYDRRNVANGLVLDLIDACPLFKDKIDATSSTLSKRSSALFLSNQIRVLAKTMITGTWKDTDDVFTRKAENLLGSKDSPGYKHWLQQFSDYINAVAQGNQVLSEISSLSSGALSANSRIPALREEGWICMTTTGLQIIGCIGHELLDQNGPRDWRDYASQLAKLDWSRKNHLWSGNIIAADGKIVTQSSSVTAALNKVKGELGLPLKDNGSAKTGEGE
jgi:DNA sulfur modification protein DndB